MSLITRCPACETMFKVVPDQLRISEGWVRCGQCGEIFNASQNLVAGAPAGSQAPAARIPQPVPPAPPPASRDAGTPPLITGAPGTAVAMQAPSSVSEPQKPDAFAQEAPLHAPETQLRPSAAFIPTEPVWAEEPPAPGERAIAAEAVMRADSPASGAVPLPATDTRGGISDSDDRLQDPPASFMRRGRDKRFWDRRPVRLALAALALLLTSVLLAQVLVQERNRLVLLEPAARPVVQALCKLAGCEIGALRQIESVVIDSSSFGRLRTDTYRLAFSLRNRAPIDIAMPAIELSLTDTQDQALIRRVMLPSEYGAAGAVLAASADWSGTLAVSIRPGAGTERIAGYRLLAFYP